MRRETNRVRVAILHPKNGYHWHRQMLPCSSEEPEFTFNKVSADDDWLFVYEGLSHSIKTFVPLSRRVFVCGEPASIKFYHSGFLEQFGTIWTTDPKLDHPGAIPHHPCTPWHVGANLRQEDGTYAQMNIRELADCTPRKTKLISVISSNKNMSQGHRDRLSFVAALKSEFGESLDVYGRGINDVDDKWQALAEYKYHIAIENSAYANYWTEKLADPILTLTYPIYYGCPNIEKYFSAKTIDRIDISDARAAIRIIRRRLEANDYDTLSEGLKAARERLISEYNLFAEIKRHVTSKIPPTSTRLKYPESIRPEQGFEVLKRAARRIRRIISSKFGSS